MYLITYNNKYKIIIKKIKYQNNRSKIQQIFKMIYKVKINYKRKNNIKEIVVVVIVLY